MIRSKETYLQHQDETTTNDPQAPFVTGPVAELINDNVAYSSAIGWALSGLQHQIRWSDSQLDREAMYKIAMKTLNTAPIMPEMKKKWMADLTSAYVQGSGVIVSVHDQVNELPVVVHALMNQPRVEIDANNKAVIRTVNQLLEGV